MPGNIPEFVLRNLYVRNSLKETTEGFTFAMCNTFAAATILGFDLEVNGEIIPRQATHLHLEGATDVLGTEISSDAPFALPLQTVLHINIDGFKPGAGSLRINVLTREAGLLSFGIKTDGLTPLKQAYPMPRGLKKLFNSAYQAEIDVDADAVIGEIDPHIYGHFVEHLESCVYGGIWREDGSAYNEDVLELIKALKPPNIRYPGGNFASDYHWEEGIGDKAKRPSHYDRAWHTEDSNQVGTHEFLDLCEQSGAEPFLVINDGSGTVEEAARWVAYCNEAETGKEGKRRAKNGHPAPMKVRLWGLGNEVWGAWQVGHTDASGYTARIKPYIDAMRAADPNIKLVAVGLDELDGDPNQAHAWNETVLKEIGNSIDYLSFHVYHPGDEGFQESYDQVDLYHSLMAAPASTEDVIRRMVAQIKTLQPNRQIGIALDEWNIKLPQEPDAHSQHDLTYTLRDGLYIAGMFNAFHRQCNDLKIANLAQLVNVLPLIVKRGEKPALKTTLYHPFWLYQFMQNSALKVEVEAPVFNSKPLGWNISAKKALPYVDATATRSTDGNRLTLGIINRHPVRAVRIKIGLSGLQGLQPAKAWLMTGANPLAENRLDVAPGVTCEATPPPQMQGDLLHLAIPAASLLVICLEKK